MPPLLHRSSDTPSVRGMLASGPCRSPGGPFFRVHDPCRASVCPKHIGRRAFIGGSDIRVTMGRTRTHSLISRERTRETERRSSSSSGVATEPVNRRWFEKRRVGTPGGVRWMAATLDGIVEATAVVFEQNSCCLGPSRRRAVAGKHVAQVQPPPGSMIATS
jgi:hypothetical protein